MTKILTTRRRRRLLVATIAQALVVASVVAQAAPDNETTPDEQAAPATAQTAHAPNKGTSDNPTVLSEMVVTAQRRTQKLQDVPVAVTAINSAELESRGISSVADLSSVAPNLNVAPTPGNATAVQIAIRGSVTINPALFWEPTVGMYVDGVYVGKTQGSVFDLIDLERVEVLRGPQGTLYGRNTLAGAINLITHAPSGQFSGMASLDLGNYDAIVGKVSVDLPAFGPLKASVGGRIERRDGWIDTTPGSSVPQLNNRHNDGGRVALDLDATDDLTFGYRYDHTGVNQYPRHSQIINSDLDQMLGFPSGIMVRQGRQTTASINDPSFERMDIDGHALTAEYKLGNAGTLKYIGAYRTMQWDDSLDLDGSPVTVATTKRLSNYHQTSNELQWLGNVGDWNWVAGLYSFQDKGHTDNPQDFFYGAAIYDSRYGFRTKANSAYGQVDYKPTERLTLTAGLRRTEEDKTGDRFLAGPGVSIPAGTRAKASFAATTPTVSVDYKISDHTNLYGRYAEGFKSGGFNGEAQTTIEATTPYLPEKLKSFEVGTKSVFLDGTMRVNTALFYNRSDNLQESVFTAQGSAASNIRNVGRAHAQGFELETLWRATPDWTLQANYGYLQAKYDRYMELGVDVANNRAVVHSPRHTLNLVSDTTLARTTKGALRAQIDYRFTSSYYLYPYQLRLADPTSQLAANTRVAGVGILNGRLSFGGMNWGGVEGEVALWVRNVFNTAHIDGLIDFGPGFGNLRAAYYNDPRTIGVSAIARW